MTWLEIVRDPDGLLNTAYIVLGHLGRRLTGRCDDEYDLVLPAHLATIECHRIGTIDRGFRPCLGSLEPDRSGLARVQQSDNVELVGK